MYRSCGVCNDLVLWLLRSDKLFAKTMITTDATFMNIRITTTITNTMTTTTTIYVLRPLPPNPCVYAAGSEV